MLGNRTVSLGFSIHWPATQHVPFGWSSLPPFLSTPKAFLRGTVLEHNIRQNCYRVLSLTLLLLDIIGVHCFDIVNSFPLSMCLFSSPSLYTICSCRLTYRLKGCGTCHCS